jgi:uncharacterized protein YdeI (YjbR/CyaY-like superfamily)
MHMVYVKDRAAWRKWLQENHATEPRGVWLVYYRQHTGKPSLEYDASVEEALCYGWVDSLIRKIDAQRYARKFTPRKDDSNWSESNRRRVAMLVEAGLMTGAGLAKVKAAKATGKWDADPRPLVDENMSPEFAAALVENRAARRFFENLTRTQQREFILWINVAKRDDTRARRLAESLRLLEQGRKLGMK